MIWEHEGVAYFAATAPIRQPRANKPHIAITHGRWWASEVGNYSQRVAAASWVDDNNIKQNRARLLR